MTAIREKEWLPQLRVESAARRPSLFPVLCSLWRESRKHRSLSVGEVQVAFDYVQMAHGMMPTTFSESQFGTGSSAHFAVTSISPMVRR